MQKKVYVTPEIEIIEFEAEDIIVTSNQDNNSKPGGNYDEGGVY